MKHLTHTSLMVLFLAVLIGCMTGMHGSFVEKTYVDRNKYENYEMLGLATGESCQTRVLYLFPTSNVPSTAEAMHKAKAQYDNTVFLADVSVETNVRWGFLYAKVCTVVTGFAYSAEKLEN